MTEAFEYYKLILICDVIISNPNLRCGVSKICVNDKIFIKNLKRENVISK